MAEITNTYQTGISDEHPNDEGIEIAPSLEFKKSDEELIKIINQMESESKGHQAEMQKKGEDNERYWKGVQLDKRKIEDWRSQIVDNRIFLSAETIIPIMTSRVPEPTIRLRNSELREELKQILMNKWEVPNDDDTTFGMSATLEMISRHWMIYLIGVLFYEYDPEIDDVRTTYVHPNDCIFDAKADSFGESRFLIRRREATLDDLKALFPKKSGEIEKLIGKGQGLSKVIYSEFYTPDYVCYKYQNLILGKKKNPNWDYGDMGEGQVQFNVFKKPRLPFIPLNVFNLGKDVYDDTSLIDQSKLLQDGINKRKNQISDNASDQGVLVGSGDYMDQKVLEKYTGSPREKLFIKSGSAGDAITRLPPKQLPAFVFQDMQDSKSEIDNIFGAHSTTRGERGQQKTLGEAQLLKQGDLGRIDLFSRALDRVASQWYTAMYHMMMVFYTEPREINSNDEEGTSIIFDRQKYIDPQSGQVVKTIIKVKPGSAMSIDKDDRRQEAIFLAQAGLIDPISFFEKLDYSNPQEMAQQLFLWNTNPISLFPELLQAQQAAQAKQVQNQINTAVNTPIPAGTPINLPEGLQPEAPNNLT